MRVILINIIFIFLSCVVIFIGGELYFRGIVVPKNATTQPLHELFETAENAKLGYRLKPNVEVLSYKINSLGLREKEFSLSKGDSTFRILSIGDSVAFGMGVYDSSLLLSSQLESLFNKNAKDRNTEVINAGVPGYNTVQEYIFLRNDLLKYRPDFVLVNFCLNDADPIEFENKKHVLLTMPSNIKGHMFSLRSLANQSYFLVFLKSSILDLSPGLRNMAINNRVHENAWQVMKDHYSKIHELLLNENIPMLVVLFPWDVQLRGDAEDITTNSDLSQFFKEHSIPFVDLSPTYRRNKDKGLFLKDGIHLTAAGHKLASEEIFKAFNELNSISRKN